MANIQDINNIPELQSPFEQLRKIDSDGKEWWNSRKLVRVVGYGKCWNFERVIAKAQAWTSQKCYHLGEHFVETTEMAELGSCAARKGQKAGFGIGGKNKRDTFGRQQCGNMCTA